MNQRARLHVTVPRALRGEVKNKWIGEKRLAILKIDGMNVYCYAVSQRTRLNYTTPPPPNNLHSTVLRNNVVNHKLPRTV